MSSRRTQVAVDWGVIRAEWEAGASDLALSQRWGIKSENTVYRRRKAEGWARPSKEATPLARRRRKRDAVARKVVEAEGPGPEVAAGQGDEAGAVGSTGGQAPQPHIGGVGSDPDSEEFQWGKRSSVGSNQQKAGPGSSDVSKNAGYAQEDVGSDAQFLDLLTAERLRLQRRQLRRGRRAEEVAAAWLEQLEIIVGGDILTEEGQQRVSLAVTRVQAINRDKDTAGGLFKALGDLLDRSFKIQRQALGMDTTGKAVDVAPATPPASTGQTLISEQTLIFAEMTMAAVTEYGEAAMRVALGRVASAPTIEGVFEPVPPVKAT